MAKLIEKNDDVPPEVLAYDPAFHGEGQDGIRRWSWAAQNYLREDPQRRIRGMDVLGVIKECIRLQGSSDPAARKRTE
jgi:hypothetical protein